MIQEAKRKVRRFQLSTTTHKATWRDQNAVGHFLSPPALTGLKSTFFPRAAWEVHKERFACYLFSRKRFPLLSKNFQKNGQFWHFLNNKAILTHKHKKIQEEKYSFWYTQNIKLLAFLACKVKIRNKGTSKK